MPFVLRKNVSEGRAVYEKNEEQVPRDSEHEKRILRIVTECGYDSVTFISSSKTPEAYCMKQLAGSIVVFTCLFVWVISCTAPLILINMLSRGFSFQCIVFITIWVISRLRPKRLPSRRARWLYNNLAPLSISSCAVIVIGEPLDPRHPQEERDRAPVIFAVSPHGIFTIGWSFLATSPAFAGVTFCMARLLAAMPLMRHYVSLMCRNSSADKTEIELLMKNRRDLALIPGGFEEATLADHKKIRLWLKRRTGFIYYALKHGYDIRPVFSFGENQTYVNYTSHWSITKKIGIWFNKWSIPFVLPIGNKYCPLLPKRSTELLNVILPPLQSARDHQNSGAELTSEVVNQVQKEYLNSIIGCYEKLGPSFSEGVDMEIV